MERRLAAILVADIVGYSRLMGQDEARTISDLSALRKELLEPAIETRGGQVIKHMGDGWIVEFPNTSDAVICAIEVQERLSGREWIQLRIGVHIGDITFQEDDFFGDGVNIAARLQSLAKPGEVAISDTVYNSLDGVTAGNFRGGEAQQLKNITRPVHVWHWPGNQEQMVKPTMVADVRDDNVMAQPDKPSIAVLPFTNLSSDLEQEYFADGIVEDLITALSRFHWLFVISRNSSFSFKGQSVQIKQVAKELGVRYVVEGSVRSSQTRLRVTVQLIDASNDSHVWADYYDRPTGDLFDLQDEITQSITGVLVPAMSEAERKRSLRSSRPTLGAWEAYQKGLVHYYRPYNDEDHAEARRLFDQSIKLDPSFSDAHAMVALMGVYAINSGLSSYSSSQSEIIAEAIQAATRAVQLDDSNALAHIALGRANLVIGNNDIAISECETAIQLNPNLALAHHELGFVLDWTDRFEEAIQYFDKAIRLSPNDPSRWNFYLIKGDALVGIREYDQAIIAYQEASRLRPAAFWPYLNLATAYVALNRMAEAKVAVDQALVRKPDCSVASLFKILEHEPSEQLNRYIETLRQAGLPEN